MAKLYATKSGNYKKVLKNNNKKEIKVYKIKKQGVNSVGV
jgi:hypothetical protein